MTSVAVVGGGVVGASAAHRLAIDGVDVTLVDRGDAGQATAAGAGIIAPIHGDGLDPTPLGLAAWRYYPTLLSQLADAGEMDVGHEVVGAIVVARSESELPELDEIRHKCEHRHRAGVPYLGELAVLDGPGMRRLFPPLADLPQGLHLREAARVDGRRLRDSLRRAAIHHGAKVTSGSADVAIRGGRVEGVRVAGDLIPADAVILATGAWSESVAPQRGQIIHLDLPGSQVGAWPILHGVSNRYMLTFREERVVVGATREDGVGFDARTTVEGQHELLDYALDVAPGLADATLVETRVGFRPISPDGLAVLGPAPGADGLFVATGLGAGGLATGPYVGAVAADLARGHAPEIDLGPFQPARAT